MGGENRPADPDVIEFGRARPGSGRRPLPGWRPGPGRRPGWLVLVTGLAIVIAAIAVAVTRKPGPGARTAVSVTEAGHRLLGVRSGWDLFGVGPAGLVRIQLAEGRVTRTALPGLAGDTGPRSLVVGPGRAVIRPLDLVPGFLVADGKPARRLPPVLSHGGFAGPGPGPGQAWVLPVGGTRLLLVSLLTGATIASVPLPPVPYLSGWLANPDGLGGVLLQDTDGHVYDAGRDGVSPFTAGSVVAVGPGHWLITRCGAGGRCTDAVATFPGGSVRALPGPAVTASGALGAVSPDGAYAALIVLTTASQPELGLISLRTGATRFLPVTLRGPGASSALAWSPDSKWLFTLAADGKLLAVDAGTGVISSLGVALPSLTDLAVRSADESAGMSSFHG